MELEVKLKELEDNLFNTKWKPLFSRDWPIIERKKYHRTQEHRISNENYEIVAKELAKLHNNAVTEFLKFFGSLKEHPSPFKNIEKGKLLLFQLLAGITSYEVPNCPYSTYREVYKAFWRGNKEKIQKWCDEWVGILSTPEIRLLYSYVHNPDPFKGVTMFIDAKDFIIHLDALENEMKKTKNGFPTTISRKLNWKNAGKIVFLDDIKLNPIMISYMCGANEKFDGHIMNEMKIHRVMEPKIDCLIYDHGFDSAVRDMLLTKECSEKGLTRRNFCPNFGKKYNIPLGMDESTFQEKHGGFRSKQETERNAILVNTFKIFNIHCQRKVIRYEEYVLQTVVATVLLAISRECVKNGYNDVDSLWKDRDFEYPSCEPPVSSESVLELLAEGKALQEMQKKEIDKILNNHDLNEVVNISKENALTNESSIPKIGKELPGVPACSSWDPNIIEYIPKQRQRKRKSVESSENPKDLSVITSNIVPLSNLKKRNRKEKDSNNIKRKKIKKKTSNVDIYQRKYRNNTRGNWKLRNTEKILNKQRKNQENI